MRKIGKMNFVTPDLAGRRARAVPGLIYQQHNKRKTAENQLQRNKNNDISR
jgi:hypothetical protein